MNNYAVETRRRSRSLLVVEEIVCIVGDEKKEKTLKYQLKDWITKIGYTCENRTYWEYMRKVLQEIVRHNIRKAARIQNGYANENDLRKQFEQLDLSEILDVQNEISRDMEKFLETKSLLVEAEDYVEKAIQDTEELSFD